MTGKEQPFCLSVSFKAPHELDGNPPTYPVQERFSDLYSDMVIPVPETADPKYWNSFPDFFRTDANIARKRWKRSEEHTYELQSLMRISYAVFCLKKKKIT